MLCNFMLMIATLGFDEKFIVRELLRRGIDENTKLLILTSGKEEKTEEAYNAIIKLSKTIPFQVDRKDFDITDPYKVILEIKDLIKQTVSEGKFEKMIFNISGGQRMLIFCLICAIINLGIKGELVIQSESGTFFATFPSNILLNDNLDEVDRNILKVINIKGKASSKVISAELNVPQVTIWRRIKRLKELGLVEYKSRKYFLTEIGKVRV